jgi:2-succinyl-5-enolpyruvyl-6-hydroxy-3-cyclohexene-1-carboxylate synthase
MSSESELRTLMIDFHNVNTLWASILVETLHRSGLTTAVVCPGSRSTPLTLAFAQHPHIEAIPVLDERCASFFALGIAKRTKFPVALVCTSGTAVANFYPAIIEAKESRVPLLILTADRPPELRHCHAGQTIDQIKIYGNYPNWQAELAIPSAEMSMLRYLRQNIIQAIERSQLPTPGVVHLNMPFRDPLAPISQPEMVRANGHSPLHKSQFSEEEFFAAIPIYNRAILAIAPTSNTIFPIQTDRGIIIAGLAQPEDPQAYCQAIASLSQTLQFPVLAEALSPIRNYAELNPYLISTYDLILRDRSIADTLTPDLVIQIGELPTSKELRNWLDSDRLQRWIIDPSCENFDPLHTQTIHLQTSIEQLITHYPLPNVGASLADRLSILSNASSTKSAPTNNYQLPITHYLKHWCELETKTRQAIDRTLASTETLYEGKAAWLLSQHLPAETPIFIANSMSVRYVEFFWKPGNQKIMPYFSRGANGIDGTLSTALGVAHQNKPSVLLTGDLALLHDTNGFLLRKQFVGHLTIILINNNGGGIFENLPIAQFEPPFEEYFATPQNIDFAKLCATYDVEYKAIDNWHNLQLLLNSLPDRGIRVIEIPTNRKADAFWLQDTFEQLSRRVEEQ